MNTTQETTRASIPAAVAVITPLVASVGEAAPNPALVDDLIAAIKNPDDKIRGPAWQNAGPLGAPAVKPLAQVMADGDLETARSAKRALWKIVRHTGRPGAADEAKAVVAQLLPLLASTSTPVRREVVWMLSEIAGDEAIDPIVALLGDKEVRDDARCALTRLPGTRATAALNLTMKTAPEEFRYALADSLRARGVAVEGYPSRKLVPVKQTTVKPVGS